MSEERRPDERDPDMYINRLLKERLTVFQLAQRWKSEKNEYPENPQIARTFDAARKMCAVELEYALAPLAELVRKVLHDCIERRIGEHDMCRCRVCGVEGHNDVFGDAYGIKHKENCSVAAALKEAGVE